MPAFCSEAELAPSILPGSGSKNTRCGWDVRMDAVLALACCSNDNDHQGCAACFGYRSGLATGQRKLAGENHEVLDSPDGVGHLLGLYTVRVRSLGFRFINCSPQQGQTACLLAAASSFFLFPSPVHLVNFPLLLCPLIPSSRPDQAGFASSPSECVFPRTGLFRHKPQVVAQIGS